jgi:hypothetical protein
MGISLQISKVQSGNTADEPHATGKDSGFAGGFEIPKMALFYSTGEK